MAEQRQAFRFRLPWLPAPQPTAVAPRPSQAVQTPSQPAAPAQRPPFRPAGVAPAQPSPPTRAEPPPPSSSTRIGTPSRVTSQLASKSGVATSPMAPAASLSRTVAQTQVNTQPASAARASPEPHQITKTLLESPSPSRRAATPNLRKASATPPPTPPQSAPKLQQEAKPLLMLDKQPTTNEFSEAQKESRKQETSKPPSQKPHPLAITAPPPEKVVNTLGGENKESPPDESKLKASEVSGPKLRLKVQQIKEIYGTSSKEPAVIVKGMNHEFADKKALAESQLPGSKAETTKNQASVPDERGQNPKEEVFQKKKILKSFGTECENENENYGSERDARYNHKHASAGGQNIHLDKEIKEDSSKFMHKPGARRDRSALSEKPFSIITLTGENTGAIMHLNSESSKRERFIHIHRGYKANPDESYETMTDGEGHSRGRKSGDTMLQKESATKLYVNNNTQGINNSLVFNSSVTERNPGVHAVLSHDTTECRKPGQQEETLETHKAEVATTPAERFAYAPTIKRRCLRGLFLESSDSDPDNPDKPRRHGCLVGCSQKSKDGIVDVL